MAFEIIRAGSEETLKILVYGPSGAGKTRLIASAAEDLRMGKVFMFNFEAGSGSLKGSKVDTTKVIKTMDQFQELFTWIQGPDHDYKTVAIDSGTDFHRMILEHIVNKEKGKRNNSTVPQQQDYGLALTLIRQVFRVFRDAPLNFICTALVKEEFDQREGTVRKPSFIGSFAEEAPAMFDCLAYLGLEKDKDKDTRVLVVQGMQGLRAKFRVPVGTTVPNKITEPTFSKIYDLKEGVPVK